MAVIGLGSNLLVADEGYDGVALRLEGELAAIEIERARVRCGGGASLAAVVRRVHGGLRSRASSSAAPSRARSAAPCA